MKRVRLVSSDEKKSMKLKTTRIEFSELKEKATRTPQGKYAAKYENPHISITKGMLLNLIEDTESLMKELKKAGVTVTRELHYNETDEWKSWQKHGFPKDDVPAFIKAGKRGRVRL